MKKWTVKWYMTEPSTLKERMKPILRQPKRVYGVAVVEGENKIQALEAARNTTEGRANAGRLTSIVRA